MVRMLPLVRTALVIAASFLVLAPPAGAWTWPASGPVLRGFSLGDNPYAGGQHRGIDVGGAEGEPVLTPRAGTVSFAGSVPNSGFVLTIATDDGYSVTLVHLGSIGVKRGASVVEGAQVGTLGSSGEREWPVAYVHLGVRIAADPNGYLDPLTFLPSRTAPPAPPQPPPDPEPAAGPPAAEPARTPEAPSPSAPAPAAVPTTPAPAARPELFATSRRHPDPAAKAPTRLPA